MAHSNALIVAIVALLAACATCVPDTGAAVAVQEVGSVDSSLSVGARDLLRKRKRVKKTKKRRVKRSDSVAQNINNEGVLINQQTTANIDGSNNTVVGGETAPIFNANLQTGDIFFDRKLKSVGGGARDILRKRRRKSKKTTKKNIKRSRSAASNVNNEGVLINQQTTANIEGSNNTVVGGETAPIFNANADVPLIIFDRKLLSAPGGGARDLLRKKRRKSKKSKKKNTKRDRSDAANANNEGVLAHQLTNTKTEDDGSTVSGAFTDTITNINVKVGNN